ncbi:uncharacterized protein LOC130050548 [Ostrea edulis]|uniref:uncharacterized protein LOC130050548 n=1 Tax=Ostrea edulis TaxID=37623 RepID=UPI0024AFAA66|nr:uncharacterized protein LOC130050548 [Ostrea edulis]
MEAETVATKIVEDVVSRFGVPAVIHSDQGPQYESKLFKEMCRVLDNTTLYHLQSDGIVERFNRTLTTMLSGFVNEHHTDWDVHLPFIMMAYRSSVHETPGMTLNVMMFGREVSTPLDLMYKAKEVSNKKWSWYLQERLENAPEFVRTRMNQAMNEQKAQIVSGENDELFTTFEIPEGSGPTSELPVTHHSRRNRKPPSCLNDYETDL